MVKINKLSVTGLRGVRHDLAVHLSNKSALLYGDNGSGKSTLSDVFEWFFYDRIGHLAGEEIGRKGYEALRNIFLDEDQPGSLAVEFNKSEFTSEKTIELDRGNLKAGQTNNSESFIEYLSASKTDKLRALSEIIGYSKVTGIRDTLRAVYNRLSRDIKSKGFDNQINHQQSQIIEQFGQNVNSDEQFIEVVNELVKAIKLDMKIEKLKDVNEVLTKIKKPDDTKEIKQESFLVKIGENLVNLPENINEIEKLYKDYKTKFDAIVSDVEKLKKLTIERLLDVGQEILSGDDYTVNNCPLCLEEQNKAELLTNIKTRLAELEEIKREQRELKEARAALEHQISAAIQPLQQLTGDKQIDEKDNAKHKINVNALITSISTYLEPLKIKVAAESKLNDEDSLKVNRKTIETLQNESSVQLEAIRKTRKKDPKWDAHGKINIAAHAYAQIRKLRKEKVEYEKQRDTMEIIYKNFLKKQKESLEAFLETFSEKIDEIYQFLNPGEKVDNIKLIPLEKNNELSGITIQFDFLESKDVTAPQRFLSESHINCLGIAFYLTSVDAFNKQNKFMVLDDVISSFDANHRKRFADLLIEKYSDYQIILLTHEKTWFDIVKNLVRGKNWCIKTIKYNEAKGTHLDEAPQTLRERIEKKITDRDETNLGNDARKYLEYVLKHIAINLEVKVPFRFNDVNEDRMAYELLTELKGTINKRKSTELQSQVVIDRLLASTFIGNKDSHDSSTILGFGDMKAFWQDVVDFEKLFFCDACNTPVSLRYYKEGTKQVRCKKGELSYTWKK